MKLRDAPFEPVAYASQNPWFQNGTIRDNILFGSPLIRQRYQHVLKTCSLELDLAEFEEGDLKDVGENGSALSGGQRQRIALARALYSNANTVILDDVLSALDSTTATSIVDNCILGPLMKDRTLILVTDNAKCLEKAHLIVRMDDGTIKEVVRKTENDSSLSDRAEATSLALAIPAAPETPPRPVGTSAENAIEMTSPRNSDSGKRNPVTLDSSRRGLLGTGYGKSEISVKALLVLTRFSFQVHPVFGPLALRHFNSHNYDCCASYGRRPPWMAFLLDSCNVLCFAWHLCRVLPWSF